MILLIETLHLKSTYHFYVNHLVHAKRINVIYIGLNYSQITYYSFKVTHNKFIAFIVVRHLEFKTNICLDKKTNDK